MRKHLIYCDICGFEIKGDPPDIRSLYLDKGVKDDAEPEYAIDDICSRCGEKICKIIKKWVKNGEIK